MADLKEVAEQFQNMMDAIQKNPSQVIDPQSVDFAKSIAVSAGQRTAAQKDYAKSVGEEFLIAKQLQLLDRKRTLDAQLRSGVSGPAADNAQAELDTVINILDTNKELLDNIQQQGQDWGAALGQVVEMNEFEKRRMELYFQAQENIKEQVSLEGEALELKQQELINLEDQEHILALMQARQEEINVRSALRNKQEEVFGISADKINRKAQELGELMGTTAGRLTLMAAAAKIMLQPAVEHMIELRDTGLSWNQTMEAGSDTLKAAFDIGGLRGLSTIKDTAEAVLAMRHNFADLTFQTHETAAVASELSTVFKLTADEAVDFVESMVKVGGLTAHAQETMMETAKAFGDINKVNPAALLKAAAKHAGVFARFGAEGAQSFFRSVTAAERLGIELSTIESSADKFLDIDSFFQDVSRLRTLGVDIADPFALAEVSETGTPEDIARELSRQLSGINLTELDRTARNALSQTVGMDFADISRLINGPTAAETVPGTEEVRDVTGQEIQDLGSLTEGVGNTVDALLSFVGMLGGLSGVLQTVVTLMAAQAALSTGRTVVGAGLRVGAGIAGAGMAALGTGIGIAIAGAIGLALGEGFNRLSGTRGFTGEGGWIETRNEINSLEAGDAYKDIANARVRENNRVIGAGGLSPEVLEALRSENRSILADLEQALNGIRVNIDGRPAGRLIADAQAHH